MTKAEGRESADEAKSEPKYMSNHRVITITSLNHDYTATEPRWHSTIGIIISRRRNTEFSKKEIDVTTQSSPTDKSKPAESQSTKTRTEKSTGKSTKSTKILLKTPFESASIKLTGLSPKRTSKDDYLVQQHLRVNATYR